MCGFAFLLAPDLASLERRARIEAAVQRLRHRGPDAAGITDDGMCAVGHTRLAIIDLAGGRQPLRDPSGRWVLVFNGEIYNYRELRHALRDRWQFRDASDTEVLLAGLVLEGGRFVEKLDGMWAFALHDSVTRRTILSRDRFGKKPLYYRVCGQRLACASELPALLALTPEAGWIEDPAGISDYFRYGYTMPGRTCLKGVEELSPAHVGVHDACGEMTISRYWMPTTDPWNGGLEEAAEEIRRLLRLAVAKRQLAADVEVGAFLSGGVDSTIVCALAQRGGAGRLRTYTAGFAEPTYDERAHALRVATALGTMHVSDEISPDEAAGFAAELPVRMGQPFGDASLVPTAFVSRLAARDVKVVLTGDGGDEVFGGYARYVARILIRHYKRMPYFAQSAFARLMGMFHEPIAHHSGSLLKRAHLFLAMTRDTHQDYVAPAAMRTEVLAKLVPELPHGNMVPEMPWPTDLDELRRMMLMDWLVWLPQDILTKVDRATMAYSLEARSPFLDRDLVEFVIRLPWPWHFSRFRGKRLLRHAMGRIIPGFVWARRKQGFASPVGHWMMGSIGDRLHDLAAGDGGVVDVKVLRALLAEHRAGKGDHSQPLWLTYCYLRWRQEIGAA